MPSRVQEPSSSVNGEISPLGQMMLNKMTDGVMFISLSGKVIECNDAAQKMVGKVRGRVFWEVLADDCLGFSLRESLRYGISHGLIYRGTWEISTSFYYAEPRGLAVFLKDIGEKQKFQAALSRADRMKELGEMAAKLSHEIRNCLGGIRGFASLLLRDLMGQGNLQEMVTRVIDGTKSLEKLVTSVLVYARPDQITLQTLDLSAFLRQVARTMQVDPVFPPNVRFRLHIPDAPMLIPFDPEALKRCLINLLMNAIQAMPDGGDLLFSLLKTGESCQIVVADTGIGMSDEVLQTLFSPCFTTKKTGNGLGLVEVKKIAQAHGGRVDVRSAQGRGTTFTITLKVKHD